MDLTRYVDELARHLSHRGVAPESREKIRDYLDAWSQWDLDLVELDILTDMVVARLKKVAANEP